MNEPRRWLDDGAHPIMGQVLRAGGEEQPPPGSLQRALTGVGLGAGVAGAASGAAAAASSSGIFLKWTLLGCAVTLGTVGAFVGLRGLAERRPAPEPSAVARAAPAVNGALASTPAPEAQRSPPLAPAGTEAALSAPSRAGSGSRLRGVASSAAAPSEMAVDDIDALARETRLIERARAESAAGRNSAAIATLDEYERRFSIRRYAPEALYLRMEALLGLGQHAAARQVAVRLATGYPSGPHAARAEAVRGAKNP